MSAGQVLFLHTSFCFVSFAHDGQMVDGMRDGWGSVWIESQIRHIEAILCVGISLC